MIGRAISIPVADGVTISAKVDKTGTIRSTLGTSDPAEIKARNGEAGAFLERLFKAEADERPMELTHRHAVALSGMLYLAWIDGEDREEAISFQQGPDGRMHRVYDELEAGELSAAFSTLAGRMPSMLEPVSDHAALEAMLGPILDRMRERPDVMLPRLADRSRQMVLVEFAKAVRDAWERRARQANSDYRPDPNSERFPAWVRPVDAPVGDRGGDGTPSFSAKVTLSGLVEDWWTEQATVGKAKSTYVNYKGVFGRLVAFLELEKPRKPTADDAQRLTDREVVAFKDYRLQAGISPRTVDHNDLAALRSVLGWAVTNRKLQANVAEGIKVGGVKKEKRRGFRNDEAKALLKAATAVRLDGQEYEETARALRWAPWLMAYTGARVGEIGQLRKEDVALVNEDGEEHWAITITPEAGTVKGGKGRQVPLHPHLVEMGFAEMVQKAPGGHLFLRPNAKTGDVLGPLQGVKNRLAEAARTVVPDKGVSPNHGWRHWFITRCRKEGVSQELRRMITGHSGEGVDEQDYGEAAGLYGEIRKLPRIVL